MRRNRLVWLTAWIISIIIISFYGGAVSYGLFTMLTLIPALSILYIILVAAFYRIYQKIETNNIVSNHTVDYYFSLQNESFFSFPGIKVDFYSDFSEIVDLDSNKEYELSPKSGQRVDTSIVCKYRGEYEVGVKNIIIQDPFRLFCFTFKNPEPLIAKVKPDVIELDELRQGDETLEMKKESRKNKNERDVFTRNYIYGDSVKSINWKASVASGELLVRKENGEEKGRVRIILDTFRHSYDPFEYLPLENRILETVIAISLYYVKKNIPVTLSYMQNELINSHFDSLGQFDEFYNLICEMRFSDGFMQQMLLNECICDRESENTMATIFVFHSWNPENAKTVTMLTEMGNLVEVYHVSGEEENNVRITGMTQINVPIEGIPEDII